MLPFEAECFNSSSSKSSNIWILCQFPVSPSLKLSISDLCKFANSAKLKAVPDGLSSSNTTTYISLYFPNGLLYCCLSEAYGFLKGPIDMLTLYENKYKQEVQKFANEQVGRRRRDDYTDGAVRIPVNSANP